MTRKDPRVVFVSGLSNSGKTTLIERLIPRLRQRGLRVGTIKHAHDRHDLDRPGKDSWRHTQAGASAVTLMSPGQTVSFVHTDQGTDVAQAVAQMAPYVDLVLAEGFKAADGRRVLIAPDASERLQVESWVCRVGIFPERLSELEVEQIVQFCWGR